MLRLVYLVTISFPLAVYYLLRCNYIIKHIDKYSEEKRYKVVQNMVRFINRNARVTPIIHGVENLPDDGGYVMYPNHQGRYDILGILKAHAKPCTFVIDKARTTSPFAREVTYMLQASPLDKTDPKAQVKTILDVIRQVKEGRRYVIFPEGTYSNNKNTLQKFLPGAFKCSIKSKTPIIPVALKDSYKVFGINSLKRVTTEVFFLEPLYYEDYKDLNSAQIADIVKEKIESVLLDEADDCSITAN